MNHLVVFSPKAIADIAEVLDFLLPLAGERAARRFVDDLVDHCHGFATFPERGLSRADLAPGLRIVGYRRRASIAFLVQNETITIMRIFYAGREIRLDRT
ncbi:MAG: type II toxin-antitoxin system RelE/ParE family toxin [Rhizobium rhizophilum]|uniref:type II toxin-antitoxin system RelE/ParE family toxin n=1 Tax=Rhizobium rhizophilum TaxID=1850373 RepID=UPI00391BDCF3